jgi:membrane-associated protein
MAEFFQKVWHVISTIVWHIFVTPPPKEDGTPVSKFDKWAEVLNDREVFWPVVAALAFIIFAETGLLVGFFLPGDSLLVTVGIVARSLADDAAEKGIENAWNIWAMMGTLIAAAIVGDSVGYWFGAKAGPKLFNRPQSRWFKRDHLLSAKAFFDRHGGKAIILARFMPFARTFVPVVAGAARMNYRWFFFYNVAGGVLWIASMLLFGYTAKDWLEPLLQKVFGPTFDLRKNMEALAVVIIVLSLTPMFVHYLIERRRKKKEAARIAATTPTPTPPTPG